jgi:hypothetical protein
MSYSWFGDDIAVRVNETRPMKNALKELRREQGAAEPRLDRDR